MEPTPQPIPHGRVDLTNAEYHAGPGISKSHLDWIAPEMDRTPLHYWNRYLNPEREADTPTLAQEFGTAAHIAILEPDRLHDSVVRGLDIQRRSTADKFTWAQFEDEHAGKIILKPEQHDRVLAIRDAVHRHPVIGPLLSGIETEQSFYTQDAETGETVKCRFDALAESGAYSLDLKTTESAGRDFGWSARKYRYWIQPPWYEDILQALFGERPAHWMFVAVEKAPPYACGLYYATDEMRRKGRESARRDLRLIAQCRASGTWPDFAHEAQPLDIPGQYGLPRAA